MLGGIFSTVPVVNMKGSNTKVSREKQQGWRGSEKLWLDAAYQLLIESGVDAVKVMPLAKSLGLSRTSFYWHFSDREALLSALITRWQSKNTANLITQTQLAANSISEAIFNLFDCWVNPELFDARMDFAIRNWALQSPSLKQTLQETDQQRIAAIYQMFLGFNYSDEQANARAHTVYYTQVGYITMMVDEPMPDRLQLTPAYIENFTGHYPKEAEINCFMRRHETRLNR